MYCLEIYSAWKVTGCKNIHQHFIVFFISQIQYAQLRFLSRYSKIVCFLTEFSSGKYAFVFSVLWFFAWLLDYLIYSLKIMLFSLCNFNFLIIMECQYFFPSLLLWKSSIVHFIAFLKFMIYFFKNITCSVRIMLLLCVFWGLIISY